MSLPGPSIISDADATATAGTYWGSNPHLKRSLLAQSRAARNGLLAIVLGTILQIIGTGITLLP
jgi:hypothetical protein